MRSSSVTRLIVSVLFVFLFYGSLIWYLIRQRNIEQKQLIEQYQYLVQAILNYKAVYGFIPDTLEDLAPEFLPEFPADWKLQLSDNQLSIRTRGGPLDNSVAYSFNKKKEGWSVRGYPKLDATRPVASPEELIDIRLKELDRRIAKKQPPESFETRLRKIAYLISINRSQDAEAECEILATDAPQWWVPQYGLAVLADAENEFNAAIRFGAWVAANPTFLNYYFLSRFHRENGQIEKALAALRKGATYPINMADSRYPGDFYGSDGFAMDAVIFANQHADYQLTLEISHLLSSFVGYSSGGYRPMDFCAFQAAAQLGLGNVKEANESVAIALESNTTRLGKPRSIHWVQNLEPLRTACEKGDRTFRYDPGPNIKVVTGYWDWIAGARMWLAEFVDSPPSD